MADFGLLGAETARQRVGGGSSTSERPEDVKRLQQLAVGEVRKNIYKSLLIYRHIYIYIYFKMRIAFFSVSHAFSLCACEILSEIYNRLCAHLFE